MRRADAAPASSRLAATVCPFCGVGCSMLFAGAATYPRLRHPVSQGALCLRGWSAGELLHSPLRVAGAEAREREQPPRALSVEDALEEIIERLARIRDAHGGAAIGVLGSARLTVEEIQILRRLAAALG